MSICDGCIHDDVCGLEDNHEEGIVSCADRIPKDVLNKIRAEIEEAKTVRVTANDTTFESSIDAMINPQYRNFTSGLDMAISIIDKYRKGENE